MRHFNYIVPTGVILLALLFSANLGASNDGKDGIKFLEGTWSEALEKSRQEHKPIFLDVYATWCGPCRLLKKTTFPDKVVGTYFNEHFINVSIDGETEIGRELMKQYGLRSYPSLLIIGEDQTPLIVSAGYRTSKSLLEFGKSGLSKIKQ